MPQNGNHPYLKLKEVEREVGLSRVTLRRYMQQLGIQPTSWHIGDRSLYISQDAVELIRKLKQNPALLPQLRLQETRRSENPNPSSPSSPPDQERTDQAEMRG